MIGLCPILYFGWKIIHKTKIHKASEIDLQRDLAGIEEYHRNYVPPPPGYVSSFPPSRIKPANRLTYDRSMYSRVLDKLFG